MCTSPSLSTGFAPLLFLWMLPVGLLALTLSGCQNNDIHKLAV